MLDVLRDPDAVVSLGAWAYLVLAVAVAVDSILPLLPSEVLALAAGAFTATGELDASLVLLAVVAGGVTGDLVTYHLGLGGSRRAARTMAATPRRRRMLARMQRSMSTRRTATIVAARFVPGGRTGVGLLAGMTRQPRTAYVGASLLGVALWAVFVVGTGYLTGRSAGNVWVSIGVGVVVMATVSVLASWRTSPRRATRPDVAAEHTGIAA